MVCRPQTRLLSSLVWMIPTSLPLRQSSVLTSILNTKYDEEISFFSLSITVDVLRCPGLTGRWRTLTEATCTAAISRKRLPSSLKYPVLTLRRLDWSRSQTNFLERTNHHIINIDQCSQEKLQQFPNWLNIIGFILLAYFFKLQHFLILKIFCILCSALTDMSVSIFAPLRVPT